MMGKIPLLALLLAMATAGRAQFFKKLADNVKQTAQNKANQKASDATSKAIDSAVPGLFYHGTVAANKRGTFPFSGFYDPVGLYAIG